MVKIGMMIGDRYEILEKIGTGGTSDVYKAKCHKLNRYVAVKVLKQEFSENTGFVGKFRTEAQAAAGLMHANIVNVYDVGEENGVYYIVMELVEGITLKKYIEKKGRLSVKEAVSIAIQVALGIEAAHNNRIIHRDIKPQNIIISKEGRVKVTDFGIAKAASSNTITSNVMGSVHYTSPEQARGGYSDAKSDIYSLGITLFEMLTGRIPFNGETTVSIAIKHIQEDMPSPRLFVADIPVSVEQIVLKCTQKVPDKRYRIIADLIEDLKRSLLNPNEVIKADKKDDSLSHTVVSGTPLKKVQNVVNEKPVKKYPEPILDNRKKVNDSVAKKEQPEDKNMETQMWDASRVETGHAINENSTAKRPVRENGRPTPAVSNKPNNRNVPTRNSQTRPAQGRNAKNAKDEDYEDRSERIMTTVMVVAIIIIGVLIIYAVARFGNIFETGSKNHGNNVGQNMQDDEERTIKVMDVVGKRRNVAKVNLEDQGFKVEFIEVESEEVEAGYVINQNPVSGTAAKVGSKVTVTVSLGKQLEDTIIPPLLGLTEEQLIDTLTNAKLDIGDVSYEHSNEYEAGTVCKYGYPADQIVNVPEGTKIDVVISLGSNEVYYYYDMYISAPFDYTDGEASVKVLGPSGELIYVAEQPVIFPLQAHIPDILNMSWGYVRIEYSALATVYNPDGTSYQNREQKMLENRVAFTKKEQ